MLVFAVAAITAAFLSPSSAAGRQFLHGHVPAIIGGFHLQPVGRLPAQEHLGLVIGLPLRSGEEFSNLLQQIYDPSSPQYHRYLTPQQIAERFGPAEQDYQAVVVFAQTNGLQVSGVYADRTLLRVDGTVADIEKTFHVTMLVYSHPTEARTFYAPDAEPSPDLAVPILHISGLNDYILPRPSGHIGTSPKQGAAMPAAGSGSGGAYLGNDFRAAYVPGTSLNGAGQAVGLLELDGYYTNDILTYETNANLPNVTLTNALIDGFSGTPDSDANWVGEVSLDIEMVISMAPGISKVLVYEAPNCCYYWVDILKQMDERFHGGKRGVAGHDDFVTGTDALELVQQINNHRPGRTKNALGGAGVGGQFGLKSLALGREDVLAGADGAQGGFLDFGVHETFGQGDFAHNFSSDRINRIFRMILEIPSKN